MPYEFKIGEPGEVLTGVYGDYLVDFDLGEISDTVDVVQMVVALVEDDETRSDPFELMFGIRLRSLETGKTSETFFDYQTARTYVTKQEAELVMPRILESVRRLVRQVNPFELVMELFEADLPGPAMHKYMSICNELGRLGYSMTKCWRDGTDLKDYWFFTK